jgi:hypothetical protein
MTFNGSHIRRFHSVELTDDVENGETIAPLLSTWENVKSQTSVLSVRKNDRKESPRYALILYACPEVVEICQRTLPGLSYLTPQEFRREIAQKRQLKTNALN